MRCPALLLTGLLTANAGLAQPGDPLDSPGCRQALAALHAAEDRALDKPVDSPRPQAPWTSLDSVCQRCAAVLSSREKMR